ncbi:MAG TPA: ABC transporter permease [Bacteroidota bacterium]|nr:ABC transporter permease [Bacteroidota bacterium]
MKIPLSYNIRNLWARRLTMSLTMTGIMLVVFVFAAVLMLAEGVKQTLVSTGSDDNVIIIRKSAQSELVSAVGRESVANISTFPEVATNAEGKPMATADVVSIINLNKKGTKDMGNVPVRGISPGALGIRPQVSMKEGRMFQQGSTEIIVGNAVASQFDGVTIGQKIQIGTGLWTVVGIFDAGKSGFASEVWADAEQLMLAFNRPVYSTLTVRLKNADDFNAFKTRFEGDQRLADLDVKREKTFYEEQSQGMAVFIRVLGLIITIIFSAGAMIGAMITMYAAVANRTVEIGTMRALGFQRRSILAAFLIEAIFLSLIGGGIGLALASLLEFVSFSTTNFTSFTELAFGFHFTPVIAAWTMVFSLVMGLVGGFLPAVRASRLDIITALRAS